jgi:hypothetical protein
MPKIDIAIFFSVLLLAVLLPARQAVRLRHLWRVCSRISQRPTLMISGFVCVTLILNVLVSVVIRFPEPFIADEFSVLFGAQTFAAGRLTNPSPPFYEHFASMHNIERPTWQMKYPPGLSLILTPGVLLGIPILGIWLSSSLAIGGLCWMLLAVLPRRWALVGTLVGLFNWWLLLRFGQSFLGGAGAMFGGALVLGSVVRLSRNPRRIHGAVLAGGLSLLAVTRPYEGLLLSIPGICFLMAQVVRSDADHRRVLLERGVLPCLLTLVATFSWIGYYNFRVTGSATTLPYQLWSAQKSKQPLLGLLGFPRQMESQIARPERTLLLRFRYKVAIAFSRIKQSLLICFPVVPGAALFFLVPIFRSGWTRFFFLVSTISWLSFSQVKALWITPEYVSPVVNANIFLLTQGLRGLYTRRFQSYRPGSRLAPLLIFSLPVVFLVHLARTEKWTSVPLLVTQRQVFVEILRKHGGRDMVFVELFGMEKGDYDYTWVNNEPDLNAADILWVRGIDENADRRLRAVFSDRVAWRLVWSDGNPHLKTFE